MAARQTRKTTLAPKNRFVLRLYVSGDATNSRIARENLEHFRARHSDCEFEIEVVDLFVAPEIALEQGIFISPALQIIEPPARGVIYGNLSQEWVLAQALDLG